MMKFKIFITALLFVTSIGSAAYTETPSGASITLTLTDTETDTLYVMKPHEGKVWCDSVKPTFSTLHAARWTPLTGITLIPTASTGMDAATETDSLQVFLYPLFPDYNTRTFIRGTTVYASMTAVYLTIQGTSTIDWANGWVIYCPIEGSTNLGLWTDFSPGYVFVVKQFNSTSGSGIYKFNFQF